MGRPKGMMRTVSVEPVDGERSAGRPGGDMPAHRKKLKKMSVIQRAQAEHQRKTMEREKRNQEMAQIREEREAALKRYREKKVAKMKRLSRKTKKGQPIMKDRIELLLEEIQKKMGSQ